MNLLKFRKDSKFSRHEAVTRLEKIGLSITEKTLENWEKELHEPQSSDLQALAKLYCVSVDELLR